MAIVSLLFFKLLVQLHIVIGKNEEAEGRGGPYRRRY